jgi:hypothetical protein
VLTPRLLLASYQQLASVPRPQETKYFKGCLEKSVRGDYTRQTTPDRFCSVVLRGTYNYKYMRAEDNKGRGQ